MLSYSFVVGFAVFFSPEGIYFNILNCGFYHSFFFDIKLCSTDMNEPINFVHAVTFSCCHQRKVSNLR